MSSEPGENKASESLDFRVLRLQRLELLESLSDSFWISSFRRVDLVIQKLEFHLNMPYFSSFGSECVYNSESGFFIFGNLQILVFRVCFILVSGLFRVFYIQLLT